ncbi:Tetratricopeptide repeat (TPR)-like superfamily protein [Thalictrum thalictroides]|uniref:Tetratricopeptide repeat (TPR)-like superfamily protein n=1 Tax=Thalictrum thalictroides TaxID=46969 RepID=A0A7J6WTQ6_THATH|nr:Tetratricopeptide repeat (TPR)-like superfamily protein [Thalictrum thalictroides]
MKVAATCMHWSQPAFPQSQSSQALASAIPSPSSSKRRRNRKDAVLVCHVIHGSNRSALFGRTSSKLSRTVSCEFPKSKSCSLRRAASASLDSFSDEEFAENIRELALRFQLSNDEPQSENEDDNSSTEDYSNCSGSRNTQGESSGKSGHYNSFNGNGNIGFTHGKIDSTKPSWLRIRPEPPYEAIPASVERKANSVDLPLSLRILQKKTQWTDEFREAGESAYCSVRKAFSSMVFIIRELQSYTIQMREFLFFEDVQGIIDRVQKEMNASFVWLFQQIFSHTPTLMMYVMILMANFTVHSMSNNVALAATPPTTVEYYSTTTETVSSFENQNQNPSLDSSQIKSFSDSSSSGKTISVGGNSGGGGKVKPIGSGTDGGDGQFDGVSSIHHHTIVPDELSQVSSFGNPTSQEEEESVQQVSINEETKLWNSIVQEASKMQAAMMDESLDHETMQKFVSPIIAEIEHEDYSAYSRTELKYQEAVSQEPNNPLLLTNYAQFLYLVVHDHDRAEEYFKRASNVKPSDAEALSKYASFLWMARKEINAAEETYLEAIEADPGNAFHAANYANFLWNTGGEDTCYPLSS